jgi:putative spermidine/putrescine transport system permease protein
MSVVAEAVSGGAILTNRRGAVGSLSDYFWRRPGIFIFLLLLPALLWFGIVYVGSLLALLVQSFFAIDDFSGLVDRTTLTLKTYGELLKPQNLDIVVRTVTMAGTVTIASAIIAFPVAYVAARYARGAWKALFYLGVMLPLWASYLVKIYAWKLILAKEGILNWVLEQIHMTWLLDWWLALPVIGGNSLSISYTGTFLVFVYIWLPYMVLPIQAAIERVPTNLLDAASDLGARPLQTFWRVIFPLALPGVIAGSIFTFSLTLGDYIVPQVIGNSAFFIGQAVYSHQGTAGNIPLAAAFTVVPIVIMGIYLTLAKRAGAFDAL